MGIVEALRGVAETLGAQYEAEAGRAALELTIAKRAAPQLQVLRYRAVLDLDPDAQQALLTEAVWERGLAEDLGGRLEPREATYRVGPASSAGNGGKAIAAQLRLYQTRYALEVDVDNVRSLLQAACAKEGWSLRHLIPL